MVTQSVSPTLVRAALLPVVRPDPGSTELEPLSGGPALAKFNAALRYLRQVPEADEMITRLQNSDNEYRIEIVDRPGANAEPNHFDGSHNVVTWDPELALEWRGDFYTYHAQSPAIILMHELGHAYHKDTDPNQFLRMAAHKTEDHRWSNLEEKRTVLQVENRVAQALGESQRNFHENSSFFHGQTFTVNDPTSTRPAHPPSWFEPVSRGRSRDKDTRLVESLHRALRASRGES